MGTTYEKLEAKGDHKTLLAPLDSRRKTPHQQRVEEFMRKAGQEVPTRPIMPDEKVRILRAKLVFEEAVRELILEGLAVDIEVTDVYGHRYRFTPDNLNDLQFVAGNRKPDLKLIADGCADTSVVTIGTLSACGIADEPLLEEVDSSNLSKFTTPICPEHGGKLMLHEGNGTYRCDHVKDRGTAITTRLIACGYTDQGPYRSPEGKWVKGPQYRPADIEGVLGRQMSTATEPMVPPGEGPDGTSSPLEIRVAVLENQLKRLDANFLRYAEENNRCLRQLAENMVEVAKADKQPTAQPSYDSGGMDLCPNCKTPLSDEMMKKMRAMHHKGVSSKGRCPGCMKEFTIEDMEKQVAQATK